MLTPSRQRKLLVKALSRLIAGLEHNNSDHQIYRSQKGKCALSKMNEAELHYHESWEIKIPIKGSLHCRLAEQAFDLKETTALLIAPQVIPPSTMPLDARRCGAWLSLLFERGDARLMLTWGRRKVLYFLSSDQKSELTLLLGRPADDFCDHIAQVLARTGEKTRKMLANKWMAILFGSLIK